MANTKQVPHLSAPDFERLRKLQVVIAESERAARTRIEYNRDWKKFTEWCRTARVCACPASTDTVLFYLTDMLARGRKVSSVTRYLRSIDAAHRVRGFALSNSQALRGFLAGARRLRCEQPDQKAPITLEVLRSICAQLVTGRPRDTRNRSILTLGFATALRRSNLAALDLADLRFVVKGLEVRVRKEKQDQEAKGRAIGVTHGSHAASCPVAALRAWLEIRGQSPGPLFLPFTARGARVMMRRLETRTIGRVVKDAVQRIGLPPEDYSGHSLRSGFVTTAVEAGVREFLIADHTGHRSLSALRRYFRKRDLFQANACTMIGL